MRAAKPSHSVRLPNRRLWPALALAITLSCAGVAPAPESRATTSSLQPTSFGLTATVDEVVDGDTIIVAVDGRSETVRLLGIDTPEKAGGPRPAECFGDEATAYASQLLPRGSTVLLSRDRESRDQYGRLLAYVFRADDQLFVNLAMVRGGFATALFFAPNTTFERDFERAANQARRDWQGFWPTCGAPDVTLAG